jgi:hypothetical protein
MGCQPHGDVDEEQTQILRNGVRHHFSVQTRSLVEDVVGKNGA